NAKTATHCFPAGSFDLKLKLESDRTCKSEIKLPAYVNVFQNPVGGFKVTPDEIDEDDPVINVKSEASSDVISTKYFISDGSSFGTPDFNHVIKNLNKTRPLLVQIV